MRLLLKTVNFCVDVHILVVAFFWCSLENYLGETNQSYTTVVVELSKILETVTSSD